MISRFVFLLPFALAVTLARAEVIYDNGSPSLLEGWEMTNWKDGDQFTCDVPSILTAVRFWTIETKPTFYGSVFWEIRSTSAGDLPGDVLYSGMSLGASRLATGRRTCGAAEVVNTFDMPAVSLPTGTYWLVLHNGPLSNTSSQSMFWGHAISTQTRPSRADMAPFLGQWYSNGLASPLAFQLYGVPETLRPRVKTFAKDSAGGRIVFTAVSGQNYRVEYKDNVPDAAWSTLSGYDGVVGYGQEFEAVDRNAGSLPRRFYRVVLITAPPPAPASSTGALLQSSLPDGREVRPNSFRALVGH
jgi:hypothetical protein